MSTQTPKRTALVIGATGGFGGHVALALQKHGWRIRALSRDPAKAQARTGARMPVEWVHGDAMDAASVIAAAKGTQLIVHGANPPRYRNWKGTVRQMLRSSIDAARATGARILLPASVYNYAPDAGSAIAEDAPQQPATRKGALRVEMEEMLRAASAESVRAIVLRAGDFFGPGVEGGQALGWLTRRRKGEVIGVYAAGTGDVGYAMAYLPDLAEAAARLVEAEGLAPYETFHFRGHYLERSDELIASIRRATGKPALPAAPFPWALVAALSPFNETFRELLEMRYLRRRSIGLTGDRLASVIGPEPHTPFDAAIAASLADLTAAESEPKVREAA
jgi:nucleoside-diphosphate-sugar epimerase